MSDVGVGAEGSAAFPLEGFLRDLLECIADGVIAADASGRFLLFNSSAQRILHLDPAEIPESELTGAGQCFLEDATTPFPPVDLPLSRALRGESVSNCLVHVRNDRLPDGIWISVNGSPLRNEGGGVYGGVVVFRDVTAERRELDRIRLLSAVTEQTADSVIITSRDGVIEYVNPAVERMTGFPPHELVGHTPRVLRSGLHTREDYAAMWSTLLRGDVFRGTLINRKRGDGEVYYSEQTITPIRDSAGRISRFVSVGKDLTSLRRSLEYAGKLDAARQVQQRMYPGPPACIAGFDVAGTAIPADETGGDYYDFLALPGGALALAVGDVSGHGLDAALHMVQARAILRTVTRSTCDPGVVLTQMNGLLLDELDDNRFITLLLACLDRPSRTLRYANAGHTTGYLLSAAGAVKAELASTGCPLGIFPGQRFDTVETPPLDEGDLLALVTDGITESGAGHADFGCEGVLEHLRRNRAESAAEIVRRLSSASLESSGGRQRDDMTIVVCKVGRPEAQTR
jgi:PAS domain S-box-containing protein